MTSFLDGKVRLLKGDCLELLPTLKEGSIDSCVTDPPYHLTSITKRLGSKDAAPIQFGTDGAYARASKGFMGKQWDGGDIAFRPEVWAEVLRALKPGAHLLAFSGTRTYHRMACAIEDAGFEIRDQIGWCYGSGFPKSHDVSKGIDRINGVEREVLGEVKGGGRMAGAGDYQTTDYGTGWHGVKITRPESESAIQWQGWGTALKPAWEPIVLARKPLSESSIAANVLKHGTGGINVDGCRIGTEDVRVFGRADGTGNRENWRTGNKGVVTGSQSGRWPANLIHDGSEEVVSGFPETQSGAPGIRRLPHSGADRIGQLRNSPLNGDPETGIGDSGSAARFFYTAKADHEDRLGSKHPTVKPLDLIQYLVRLVTPRGGLVLDPFAGTGTAGEASFREGMACVLIEREPEYQTDIERRMALVLAGPDERTRESIKARGLVEEAGPLFGEMA
jgi:DNA modification methylase